MNIPVKLGPLNAFHGILIGVLLGGALWGIGIWAWQALFA